MIGGQHDKFGAIVEFGFGADDQRKTGILGCLIGTHDPGQGTFVGNRQCTVTEFPGALEQFLRARCAALETEIGKAVQFGIERECR